jgi:hypothetical protein
MLSWKGPPIFGLAKSGLKRRRKSLVSAAIFPETCVVRVVQVMLGT